MAEVGDHQSMKIYLDTEFTDFGPNMELISIGLVTESCDVWAPFSPVRSEQCFYGEMRDFSMANCSDFVRQIVLPQLGEIAECVFTENGLRDALTKWLYQFDDRQIEICVDYSGDWDLLTRLLAWEVPSFLKMRNIYSEIDDVEVERFFSVTGRAAHHALHDAQANCAAHRGKGIIDAV